MWQLFHRESWPLQLSTGAWLVASVASVTFINWNPAKNLTRKSSEVAIKLTHLKHEYSGECLRSSHPAIYFT